MKCDLGFFHWWVYSVLPCLFWLVFVWWSFVWRIYCWNFLLAKSLFLDTRSLTFFKKNQYQLTNIIIVYSKFSVLSSMLLFFKPYWWLKVVWQCKIYSPIGQVLNITFELSDGEWWLGLWWKGERKLNHTSLSRWKGV